MAPWAVTAPVQLVRAAAPSNGGLGAVGYHLALGASGALERPIGGLDPGREYRLSLRYARDSRSTAAGPAVAALRIGSLDTTLTATAEENPSQSGRPVTFGTYVGTFTASARSEELTLAAPGTGAGLVVDNLVIISTDPGSGDVPVRYEFEEGTGTTATSTGTSAAGPAVLTGATAWTPPDGGVLGRGIDLPGGDRANAVDLPDDLLRGAADFTASLWVRPDAPLTDWTGLLHLGNGTEGFFQIQTGTQAAGPTGLAATFKAPGADLQERVYATPTTDLAVDRWNHVAFTRSGPTGTLYLDGTAVATRNDLTIDLADIGATADNWIGRNGFPDPAFNGRADELRLYPSTLSAAEVASLHAEGSALRTTTAVTVAPASPSPFGAPVTVSAQVGGEDGRPAEGTAELWVDGTRRDARPVAAGAVAFPDTALSPGDHQVEVRFAAADGWRDSTGAVAHAVERPPVGEGVPVRYTFDEGTGRQSANSGTDPSVGPAVLSGDTAWSPDGRFGAAVSLPGGASATPHFVDLPDDVTAGMDSEFTVSLWIRPDALPAWVPHVQIGSSTDRFFLLQSNTQANGATGLAATFKAAGVPAQERLVLGAGNDVALGAWTHVVFTQRGAVGKIYLDGQLRATRTDFTIDIGDIGTGGTTANFLGNTSWGDPHLDGLVDDFRLYGYELSAEQVGELFAPPAGAAPVGVADAFTTAEGAALTVPAPGVLTNDTDADGDPLTATDATQPVNGTVALAADGSFTYTPDPGFSGRDVFTYVAADGTGRSAPTGVTLTVTRPQPPAATEVSATAERTTYGRPTGVAVAVAPAQAEGAVQVWRGAALLGTGTLAAGRADVAVPARALLPGEHLLTLRYGGSPTHLASTGYVLVGVDRVTPTMVVDPPQRDGGKPVTVRVALTAPDAVPVAGTVEARTGDGQTVSGTLAADGTVVLTLPRGVRKGTLTVDYLGSALAAAVRRTVPLDVRS
jgi:hypothetical protein